MVEVGTGTSGTRFLKTDWPVEEGLTAGTTKLKDDFSLVAENDIRDNQDDWGID